jgi:NADH-quinone oxidoreductase subunit L
MIISLALIFSIPWLCLLALVSFRKSGELVLSRVVWISALLHVAAVMAAVWIWILRGGVPFFWAGPTLYRSGSYQIGLSVYMDKVSAVFLTVSALLVGMVLNYSRHYLHREAGYFRFFSTLWIFVAGLDAIFLLGSLDLLFAGWELVGIASFLLIGFYRSREQPVQNSLRVYMIYRFCDLGLLLGAWMTHLIWHQTETFADISQVSFSVALATVPNAELIALGALIVLSALGKSAQFPFTGWLPRAMEGPTPSSAIFYGALSVHAGVFLLLRTYPIWQASDVVRFSVGLLGVLSAVLATGAGRTQANIKGQIAYASATQVGLMFLELALGFKDLALFHFVGNASLRCYQLLISPSVVVYLLRIFSSKTSIRVSDWSVERLLPQRLRSTLYVFAMQEGGLETLLRFGFWIPLKRVAGWTQGIGLLAFVVGVVGVTLWIGTHSMTGTFAALAVAISMVFLAMRSLAERNRYQFAWWLSVLSSALPPAVVGLADQSSISDLWLYWAGFFPAAAIAGVSFATLRFQGGPPESSFIDLTD